MAKRIGDDLAILIAGYRGKIRRSNERAEPLVLSPKLFGEFLDKVEERLQPREAAFRSTGHVVPPDFHGPKDDF